MRGETYRGRTNKVVVSAIRYGDGVAWTKEDMSKVASFVLGLDVDAQTTAANERVLDVVQPMLEMWDAKNNIAPIVVSGVGTMEFGDWLVRVDGEPDMITSFKNARFVRDFEKLDDVRELTSLVLDNIQSDRYSITPAVAENVASAILRAGWSKKEKS